MLLVLALAGLTSCEPTQEQFVVFAVDDSLSVGDEARKAADEFLDRAVPRPAANRYAVLPFAAEPGLRLRCTTTRPTGTAGRRSRADAKGTNIAAALEVAAAAIPPFYVPQIVAAHRRQPDRRRRPRRPPCRGGGAGLDRPAPGPDRAGGAGLGRERPGPGPRGRAVLRRGRRRLQPRRRGRGRGLPRRPQGRRPRRSKLKKGENRFRFRQSIDQASGWPSTPPGSRASRTSCSTTTADSGLVFTSGKPRVLLVDSDPKQAKHLDLAPSSSRASRSTSARRRACPTRLADLQNYELLILSNVPATAMTHAADGGRPHLRAGPRRRPDHDRRRPVVRPGRLLQDDARGDPAGPQRLREGEGEAEPGDGPGHRQVRARWAARRSRWPRTRPRRRSSCSARRTRSASSPSTARLSGSAEVQPCAEQGPRPRPDQRASRPAAAPSWARRWRRPTRRSRAPPAKLKHVIILTDGISAPGDFEGIAQNMAQAKITVLDRGRRRRLRLQAAARRSPGSATAGTTIAEDPANVPQIFAKETVTASKSAINEQPFTPASSSGRRRCSPTSTSTTPRSCSATSTTRPKPTSELILATEKGDPLLAWWRYGLGMTRGVHLRRQEPLGGRVAELAGVQQVLGAGRPPRDAQGRRQGRLRPGRPQGRQGDGHARRDRARPASSSTTPPTELTVIDPAARDEEAGDDADRPRAVPAEFDATQAGAVPPRSSRRSTTARSSASSRAGWPSATPTSCGSGRRTATCSGRSRRPPAGGSTRRPRRSSPRRRGPSRRATPLWPYLVAAAALLFVLDVALRRIDLALFLPRRVGRAFSRAPA